MTQSLDVFIIDGQNNHRLDKSLAEAEQLTLSRVRVQALIKAGQVLRDGTPILDPNHKVKTGDTYTIIVPPLESAIPEAQKIPITIVYEDNDLLVIDKPAGLVVHPAAGNRDHTLVNALLAHCGDSLSGIGGVARPGIVHRLDKNTSGLMVVAKHDAAHHGLTEQFADRSLSRVYQALVWGIPKPATSQINGAIGRDPRSRQKMAVVRHGGKEALTHYKVLERFDPSTSLVECRLATGRTHQIRVHMASIKHPVVGDGAYGRGINHAPKKNDTGTIMAQLADFPRQALHAAEIKFIHPITRKAMRFKSELPKDMAALLKGLRKNKKK